MDESSKFDKEFEKLLSDARKKFDATKQLQLEMRGSRNDFILVRNVGSGSFGKVFLAVEKQNNKIHAIKALEKRNISKNGQVFNTKAEITFMHKMNFPFIISLEYLFLDNVYLYVVMPYMSGGEMYKHLKKLKKFDEYLSKFYASQIILALDYMHTLGVVYRDLKPENILLDIDGYIKVADLGFAKKIDTNRTPEYLAPEVILNKGYDYSVDFWTLGILIYEMNSGAPPFLARGPMELYEKIVAAQFTYPPYFSKPLRHLLSNLINPDKNQRYGNLLTGSKALRSHEWFRKIDFGTLFEKKFKPPYIPYNEKEISNEEKLSGSSCEAILRTSNVNECEEEFNHINVIF